MVGRPASPAPHVGNSHDPQSFAHTDAAERTHTRRDSSASRSYANDSCGNSPQSLLASGLEEYRKKQYDAAYEHLREAAAQDSPDAMVYLAYLHMYGRGRPQDFQTAAALLTHAEKFGCRRVNQAWPALTFLRELHGEHLYQEHDAALDRFFVQDAPNAAALLEKHAAAPATRAGNASFKIGLRYFNGAAYDAAAKYLTNAFIFNKEHVDALVLLGFIHLRRSNFTEAIPYFRKAHRAGRAGGSLGMGLAYEHGLGVGQSDERARKYFNMAAERGNSAAREHLRNYFPPENARMIAANC